MFFFLSRKQRYDLKGFAKSHVIGQNPPHLKARKGFEPLEAEVLVVSQDRRYFFRRCQIQICRVLDASHQLPESLVMAKTRQSRIL